MTDQQQHPITPPPELRQLWAQQAQRISPHDPVEWMQYVSEKAAQWGADQELEACCEWLACDWTNVESADKLRADRRPKPPSLKKQALKILEEAPGPDYPRAMTVLNADQHALIRRALEDLSDE